MNTFAPNSTTENEPAKPERKRPSFRGGLSAEAAISRDSDLVDNRPQAIARRNLQATADQSPQVQCLAQVQAMIDNSPRVKEQTQRQDGLARAELQMQAAPGTIQRQDPEDEELLQGRLADSETPMHFNGDPGRQENRTGLPDNLKAGIENLSGMSMDDVKVHYNSAKPSQLNALAYAQGTDIHVASGQEQHLPHEAWHVVQQAQGRVRPTLQLRDGVSVNDDEGLEHEADVMGARASASAVQLAALPSDR